MIDKTGVEWLPIDEAARTMRVRVETIRVWVHRGKVRSFVHKRQRWVHMPTLMDAEREWRLRADVDTP